MQIEPSDNTLLSPQPFRTKTLDEKVDELLLSVSGWKSHMLVFLGISGGINAILLVLNNVALFEVLPRFVCRDKLGKEPFECGEVDFCGKTDVEYWVDRENPNTIYNWAEGIGLICRPGWQIGMLGSVYFLGWCSTLLWMPQLSDRIGRKRFFLYSLIHSLVTYAVMI
jgi:hypothetical protein